MIIDAARYSNEVLQAFIASEEMDNAARYLEAGRRFVLLSDADLESTWAEAWREYYDENRTNRWADCIDADGELTLRRLPRPEHLIPPAARKRIADLIRFERRQPEVGRELRARYDDFVRRCTVWRN
jgi:hypothetical protein